MLIRYMVKRSGAWGVVLSLSTGKPITFFGAPMRHIPVETACELAATFNAADWELGGRLEVSK